MRPFSFFLGPGGKCTQWWNAITHDQSLDPRGRRFDKSRTIGSSPQLVPSDIPDNTRPFRRRKESAMSKRKLLLACTAGTALASVSLSSGCQTYHAGLTLPSPHYLKHYPNYLSPDPDFPLQRERDSMLDPTGEIRKGAVPGALPGGLPAPGNVAAPVPAMPGN
jgi:hypothetical protein